MTDGMIITPGVGFRGLGLRIRVWNLGFRFGYGVQGLDLGDEVQGLGSRIERELGRDSGFGG